MWPDVAGAMAGGLELKSPGGNQMGRKVKSAVRMLIVAALFTGLSGSAYAAHSDRGCHQCHVVHHAAKPTDADASWGVPLWSTDYTTNPLPTYTLYSSPTMQGVPSQPDGASKLCLGCHDGSYSYFTKHPDPTKIFNPGDLATSHPISFEYTDALATLDGRLNPPSTTLSGTARGGTIATDLLDDHNKLQCSSCHDVHSSGIGTYMLRWVYDVASHTDNVMCRICHMK
jgi:hypothetical protein